MGLFSKKICSICGGPAGLIGKKKLADGLVCKNCAALFSPFYSVWKSTMADEVRAHLQYRERNRAALAGFAPTVRIGEDNALWIDPASGRFALCSEQELHHENPDIFSLRDVLECTYDIQMSQHRDDEERGDYYLYYFYFVVRMDNPNIRTARFRINPKALSADNRPVLHDQVEKVYAGERELRGRMLSALTGIDRKATKKYLAWYTQLQEMIRALNDFCGRQKAAEPAAKFCPRCGTRSEGAFCPSCGEKIPGS